MVKMPWNRNRTRPTGAQVPPEVEQYYESTRRERKGIAWLLAFATLLLTLVIAAALFFGGRWIYRKITNNDSQPAPTPVQQEENQAEQTPSGTPNESEDDREGERETAATPNNQNESEQNSTTTLPSNESQVPTTGPTPEIPRTGPTSNE